MINYRNLDTALAAAGLISGAIVVGTYIGTSVPSFWRFARTDPTFPKLFKLGADSTAVMRADLDTWLEAKREAAK